MSRIRGFSQFLLTNATLSLMLLGTSLGNYVVAQTRPTISVPEFKNETGWWWWRTDTSRELADALSNELTSTGNFSVVERQKLDAVLSEQELAELGLVSTETGAETGQLTGAQYIILGKVTSYEENVASETSGSGGGFRVFGVGFGGDQRSSKQQAYVAIDLRVVDSTTGEVVHARTVEGLATSESKSDSSDVNLFGIRVNNDSSETKKAPVGKALRAALIEATDYLSCVMVEQGICIEEFAEKEQRRRDNTRSVLDLE